MVRCSWLYVSGIFGFIAACLLSVGVVVPIMIPKMAEKAFTIEDPSTKIYKTFIDPTHEGVPLFKSNYFFNVTNPVEASKGARLILREMGPYTYRVIKTRPEDFVSWHANATIRWRDMNEYVFVPELSCSKTDTDNVTSVSIALLSMHYTLQKNLTAAAILEDWMVDLATQHVGEGYFITRSVNQLLSGYEDPVMKYLGIRSYIAFQPDTRPSSLFSEKYHECYTGGNASKWQPLVPKNSLQKMTMWQGFRDLPFWGSDFANMINGTDGTAFHPGIKCDETPYAFVSDLRRSVSLECTGSTELRGIKLNTFRFADSNLQNGTENPDNVAFGIKYKGLQPSPMGPTYMSKPFYLDADVSEILNVVMPKNADHELHDTYINVETYTGKPFMASKRLQVSIMIGPLVSPDPFNTSKELTWKVTQNITPSLMPLYWANEHVVVPEKLTEHFKDKITRPMFYAQLGGYGGAIFFFILCVLCGVQAVFGCICSGNKTEENEGLIDRDYNDVNGSMSDHKRVSPYLETQ